ncbi:hypothetical protein GTO91_01220 [Heliobacterium undosum]|uniref:Transglutaminase-like domain-containing protein n=1 Tax=Heliomicrobium undosum TaxID=121734 RepID=A0A845L5Y2_9FIRM|nr:transglutaminase family protein [Heliomicrobium undosum]MZP28341.1 hypothetical protein [Heliomicrobium undosum]
MTRLRIFHRTHYQYSCPVTEGVSETRLMPFTDHRQRLLSFELYTSPLGAVQEDRDAFGNTFQTMWFPEAHEELIIEARSLVETGPSLEGEGSPAEGQGAAHRGKQGVQARGQAEKGRGQAANREGQSAPENIRDARDLTKSHAEWLMETTYCPFLPEVKDLAGDFRLSEGGWPEILRLAERLYQRYDYRKNSTEVDSSIGEILRNGAGVCQDFSHLMAAVLRVAGVPARYVSGYIPCGGHLRGDSASHAWVEAWLPERGWTGVDPTNNCPAGPLHVKIAHGRDYGDIVPVKGVYRGRAKQSLQVSVDVQVIQ